MVKAKLKTIFPILFLVMIVSLSGCSAQVKESPVKLVNSFLVVDDISLARAEVEAVGGEINHIFFDDNVLMGEVPFGFKSNYISKIYYEGDTVPKSLDIAFNAWVKNLEWKRMPLAEKEALIDYTLEPIANDMISFEDDPFARDFSKDSYNLLNKDDYKLPYGAEPTDTSLYMIGDVSVSVILPESDGGSEDWTSSEISAVHAEVMNGLDWWAVNNPDADLVFVYNFEDQVPIASEAIESAHIDYWIVYTMDYLGYPFSGAYMNEIYDYVNDQRDLKGTDWGFVCFVVDSSNDVDGKFNDGWSAFAVMNGDGGGPYLAMTYDNNNYGIDNMDAVLAHETGHIFGAIDQYGGCACTDDVGYLNYENQNCENGCLINENSIMKTITYPFANNIIDEYARGQIGWVDTDEDGFLDIVDTEPKVYMFEIEVDPVLDYYLGTATARTTIFNAINPYYNSASINTVEDIEHRYASNGDMIYSDWIDAEHIFEGSPYERYFNFSSPILEMGSYIAQFRATNNLGGSTLEEDYTSINPLIVYGCIDLENGAYNFDGLQYNNMTNECVELRTLRLYSCNGDDIIYEDIHCNWGCDSGVCSPKSGKIKMQFIQLPEGPY